MEEVLNRLARLQEDAERNGVYDLSTKVQRIMDLMGFQIRRVNIGITMVPAFWSSVLALVPERAWSNCRFPNDVIEEISVGDTLVWYSCED